MVIDEIRPMSKCQMAQKYEVSRHTFRRWVYLFLYTYNDAPFTKIQYNRKRVLPSKWVLYIIDILG
jgi:transposase-like protein